MQNIKVDDCSIILTYSFLYDESVVKEAIKEKKKSLPKVENLLNYVDKLFEKNKAITLLDSKKSIYLYAGIMHQLILEKAEIYFFDNNIAFLYVKLSPHTKELQNLYHINKALTTFYTTKSDDYIYLGTKNPSTIILEKQEFLKKVNQIKESTKQDTVIENILKEIDLEHKANEEFYNDNYISLKELKNGKLVINILKENKFTKSFYKKYLDDNSKYSFYSPHKNGDYPFGKEIEPEFKDRVGYCKKEFIKIDAQNKNFTKESISNRHYLYFENQQELAKDTEKFDFIHCDTFISSMIMKYLKRNNGTLYYDNFNPIATNYVNSYITLTCDSSIINDEYNNHFISFEPLISSKTNRGNKIIQADFFHIYQSQADIFTLGNSRNILHILDKDAKYIMSNKEHDYFYIYLLTSVQKLFMLNIINSSIVQNQDIKSNKFKVYSWLSNAKSNYNRFLTNYNFKVISNNPSIESSYHYFRKCNGIDDLSSQWSSVSFRFADWKSTLGHIIQVHPFVSVAIALIFAVPLVVDLIGRYIGFFSYVVNLF